MIPFLKFLEFVKVVKQADKLCQNIHSNGFFHFAYSSQVEHTKKCNSIYSESKSVK